MRSHEKLVRKMSNRLEAVIWFLATLATWPVAVFLTNLVLDGAPPSSNIFIDYAYHSIVVIIFIIILSIPFATCISGLVMKVFLEIDLQDLYSQGYRDGIVDKPGDKEL